ncbi:unnamed protein product [Tuber aestivum]|uniref:Haloacid dehalogenase n=1 Tax=Tuber aestivum TaxID=59557 RepID=A0A292Q4B4_9PEZI|nr:unnamed protein product [Tuber aestivum]
MPRPNARNLLVTFDAFGTLFKPRLPIPRQYIAVAEEHGVTGLTEKQVSSSFKEGTYGLLLQHQGYYDLALDNMLMLAPQPGRHHHGGGANFQRFTDDTGGRRILPRASVAPGSDKIRTRLSEFILTSWKPAFAEGCKLYPNYGKSVGMSPAVWWERMSTSHVPSARLTDISWCQIIRKTLEPLAPDGLTAGIIPDLIRRFSTSEGYELYSDVTPCLQFLQAFRSRRTSFWPYDTVTVGVITNSDSRVVPILNSLSIGVRTFTSKTGWEEALWVNPKEIPPPKRKPGRPRKKLLVEPKLEIDFVVLSYSVGVEKPHHQIFREAEKMAKECRNLEGPWTRIHLGDDITKDYYGAKLAGWKSVLKPGSYHGEGYRVNTAALWASPLDLRRDSGKGISG